MMETDERQYAPDEVNEQGEYIKIGGSPLPGVTLRQVLRGHQKSINHIEWSPDGRYLASSSDDRTIRIWDVNNGGKCISISKRFEDRVWDVVWLPNTLSIASSVGDFPGISLWDIERNECRRIEFYTNGAIRNLNISPNGRILSYESEEAIHLWNITNSKNIRSMEIPGQHYHTWSPDGQYIASGSSTGVINVWNASNGKVHLQLFQGNSETWIYQVAWSPDQKLLVGCDSQRTIGIWNSETGKEIGRIEGHTDVVLSSAFTANGHVLISRSKDMTMRFWRSHTWELIGIVRETEEEANSSGINANPRVPVVASLGEHNKIIRIWGIDVSTLLNKKPVRESILYTMAKLVLVGDSGVGKTGLGWRLAHNEFKEHSSTHGQQFWVIPELGLKRKDGTECEAVLWDLAGQPDYRLVHSLYLDDVDTALVLFDPTNRQEPLAGVDFWLNQLKDKDKKLRKTILVGARIDRGTSTLTAEEIQAYCERNGISGGYVSTSALDGKGLPELIGKLKAQIPWDQMTTTVTTVTFKKIKEFVLALKEKTDRKSVLVQPDELRQQLEATGGNWQFSDAEMMTAVKHLQTHGYVKVIHGSNGQHSILLAPDILKNLASSIVLEARRNPRGLGVLEEELLLHGEYPFPELINLSKEESKVLLDAAAVLFLEHNLCFRETFNSQTFLVFPSLINEKRPVDETIKIEEGASYRVRGAVENVYASLVVLLGYTNTFIRTHQWQNQAQYEMGEGEICGFIQSEYRNGEIELVLYHDQNTPEPVRLTFRGLFERFLMRREAEISRYQPVICHKCNSPLARNVVRDQLSKGKDYSFCHECGEKLQLPSPEPVSRLSRREEVMMDVQQAVAQRRTAFEAALVHVKGLLRDQGNGKAPTCFISYAWGSQEHQRWVMQLAKDLRNAGADILLDRWYVVPGANLDRYIEQIMSTDYVVVVGTPGLRQKYVSKTTDPVATAELEMLNLRARQPNRYGHTILPILVEGEADAAFAPQLQKLVYVDFRQSVYYFRQLFDMIWRMYDLPFDNPLLEELQSSMTPQDGP